MSTECTHKWEFIAESAYSCNYWCEKCGAWKRLNEESGITSVYLPKSFTHPKRRPKP